MKHIIKTSIAFLSVACVFFGVGILFTMRTVTLRHQEIVKQNKESYDRFDLHYITFGEKIK
ncbi:MAG TPA: hypothetical protein VLA48_03575 [Nitrososphaeraceae archaeon]|nr:hypothetical protein [Nitrososphaeraceae archaeon]